MSQAKIRRAITSKVRKLSSSCGAVSNEIKVPYATRITESKIFPDRTYSGEALSNSTNCVGFMGMMSDKQKTNLNTKIEQKSRRASKTADAPEIIAQLSILMVSFPDVPKKMMLNLAYRYDGNCVDIFENLCEMGWEPKMSKQLFVDKPDVHFTTKYYHGKQPNKEFIKQKFENAIPGSYLTFYKNFEDTIDSPVYSFKYCLIYKNSTGELVEKPLKVPNVPDIVKSLFGLTNPLRSKHKNDQVLPCINYLSV